MKATAREFLSKFIGCCFFLVFAMSCGLFSYETKIIETVRGRLKYVQTLEYRSAGTHGGKGWVSVDKQFYINEKKWFLQDSFDGCEPNPNESLEVFKCFYIKDLKTTEFLIRMNGDNMERKDIVAMDFRNDDSGEWISIEDGKWLIYKNFLYHVLTDEKVEIKGLPDYPENNYRAASPDLQTILYQGNCFNHFLPTSENMRQKSEKFCAETQKLTEQKLIPFWITDIKTGEAIFLRVNREKYDWLIWNKEKFEKRNDWLKMFQSKLIWEKDKNGKFQLSFPK